MLRTALILGMVVVVVAGCASSQTEAQKRREAFRLAHIPKSESSRFLKANTLINNGDYYYFIAKDTPELKERKKNLKYACDNYRKAIAAGVKYASGTDGLHGQMATELERLVELDVPQETALLSATRNAADACGVLEMVGTLEAGKLADIISVYGNPLDDITALRHVNLVMKEGRRVDHLSLE